MLYLRYREARSEDIGDIPDGLYPGEYLIDAAAQQEADGGKWLEASEEWLEPVRRFAVNSMMALIRQDLAALGVAHNQFSSEHALVQAGGVDGVLEALTDRDLIYTGVLEPPEKKPDDWEERPQTLFRARQCGDDVDRPIKKSDA